MAVAVGVELEPELELEVAFFVYHAAADHVLAVRQVLPDQAHDQLVPVVFQVLVLGRRLADAQVRAFDVDLVFPGRPDAVSEDPDRLNGVVQAFYEDLGLGRRVLEQLARV